VRKLFFVLLAICLTATTGYTASNKEDYELQEKCAKDAKERFEKEYKEIGSSAYFYAGSPEWKNRLRR
jgi:hypothetical protein